MTGLMSTKTTQDKIPANSMRASNEHDQLPVASSAGGGITALQRAAGNRAVDGLLDSGGKDDGIVTSGVAPIVLGVLKSGRGQRLDPATLEFMESRLGHDFRGVRIHNDAEAESSAREVGATAYTIGHDVVFGSRRYEPQTGGGRRLIAHELAHVVQQERGGVAPTLDRDAPYEIAARNSADAIAAGQSLVVVRGATGVGMARQEDPEIEGVLAPLKEIEGTNEPVPPIVPGQPGDVGPQEALSHEELIEEHVFGPRVLSLIHI